MARHYCPHCEKTRSITMSLTLADGTQLGYCPACDGLVVVGDYHYVQILEEFHKIFVRLLTFAQADVIVNTALGGARARDLTPERYRDMPTVVYAVGMTAVFRAILEKRESFGLIWNYNDQARHMLKNAEPRMNVAWLNSLKEQHPDSEYANIFWTLNAVRQQLEDALAGGM